MNKNVRKLVALFMVVAITFTSCNIPKTVKAEINATISKNGLWKYYPINGTDCALVGYSGRDTDLELPEMIDGYKVTRLGYASGQYYYAVGGNNYVRSITIPETVTEIGAYSFYKCQNLENVYLPNSLKLLNADFAMGCPKVKYTIPGHLTQTSEKIYTVAQVLHTTGYTEYDEITAVHKEVNNQRRANGLNELYLDAKLCEAAQLRAYECSLYYSHTRTDGTSCSTAIPSNLSGHTGENIAAGTYGYFDSATVMKKWMESPGHRANILNSDFRTIGIGEFVCNGYTFWAQLFTNAQGQTTFTLTGVSEEGEYSVFASYSEDRVYDVKIDGFESDNTITFGETMSPNYVMATNNGFQYATHYLSLGDVIWESSDESVFTVDKFGNITTTGVGTATLTATIDNHTEEYTITVENKLVAISIPETLNLEVGDTANLPVTFDPVDTTDDKTITWTTSNRLVAKVDKDGNVIAEGTGTAIITATTKYGIKATCEVTVTQKEDTKEINLLVNNSENLEIYSLEGKLTYKSQDENIAIVDDKGTVTAVAVGETKIIVTDEDKNEVTVDVKVSDFELGDINKDGKVNSSDAAYVLSLYGEKSISSEELALGDVNKDGKLNSTDAALITEMFSSRK